MAFGKSLGVGKESDVYDALAPSEKRVALKFHRLGRTSFKKTKIKRNYTSEYNYSPTGNINLESQQKKSIPPKTATSHGYRSS